MASAQYQKKRQGLKPLTSEAEEKMTSEWNSSIEEKAVSRLSEMMEVDRVNLGTSPMFDLENQPERMAMFRLSELLAAMELDADDVLKGIETNPQWYLWMTTQLGPLLKKNVANQVPFNLGDPVFFPIANFIAEVLMLALQQLDTEDVKTPLSHFLKEELISKTSTGTVRRTYRTMIGYFYSCSRKPYPVFFSENFSVFEDLLENFDYADLFYKAIADIEDSVWEVLDLHNHARLAIHITDVLNSKQKDTSVQASIVLLRKLFAVDNPVISSCVLEWVVNHRFEPFWSSVKAAISQSESALNIVSELLKFRNNIAMLVRQFMETTDVWKSAIRTCIQTAFTTEGQSKEIACSVLKNICDLPVPLTEFGKSLVGFSLDEIKPFTPTSQFAKEVVSALQSGRPLYPAAPLPPPVEEHRHPPPDPRHSLPTAAGHALPSALLVPAARGVWSGGPRPDVHRRPSTNIIGGGSLPTTLQVDKPESKSWSFVTKIDSFVSKVGNKVVAFFEPTQALPTILSEQREAEEAHDREYQVERNRNRARAPYKSQATKRKENRALPRTTADVDQIPVGGIPAHSNPYRGLPKYPGDVA